MALLLSSTGLPLLTSAGLLSHAPTGGGGAATVSDQTVDVGGSTLASAGGIRPVDSNGAPVAVSAIVDQTGTTRTWSLSGGRLIADGTPSVDDGQTIVVTPTGYSNITITLNSLANTYDTVTTVQINAACTDIGSAGGKTIRVMEGSTGDWDTTRIANGIAFASTVTITDGEQGASIDGGICFQATQNITLQNLDIQRTGANDAGGAVHMVGTLSGMTIQDCSVHGDYRNPLGSYTGAGDYQNCYGITGTDNCHGLVVKRTSIYDVRRGISIACASGGFTITDNEFYNLYEDAVDVALTSTGLTAAKTFSRNVFYNFIGAVGDADDPHIDLFQFLSVAGNDGLDCTNYTAQQNVAWENQTYARGNDVQGIVAFTDTGYNMVLKDPVITGNSFHISGNHPINFVAVDGGTFDNNTLTNPSSTYSVPNSSQLAYLQFGSVSAAGTISAQNNVCDGYDMNGSPTTTGNVTLGIKGATTAYTTQFDGATFPPASFAETKTKFAVASGSAGAIGSGYATFGNVRDETGWSIP